MVKELKIPDEHILAFNRVMRRIPAEFRDDTTIRRTALIYLKVGGEKLARASIKALTTPFTEKFILRKMQIIDEDLANGTDSDDSGSTKENGEKTSKDESADTKDTDPSPQSSPPDP